MRMVEGINLNRADHPNFRMQHQTEDNPRYRRQPSVTS